MYKCSPTEKHARSYKNGFPSLFILTCRQSSITETFVAIIEPAGAFLIVSIKPAICSLSDACAPNPATKQIAIHKNICFIFPPYKYRILYHIICTK